MAVLSVIFGKKWPTLLTAAFACFSVLVWPSLINAIRVWKIPIVGKEWGGYEKRRLAYTSGARKVYIAGYQKVRCLWQWKCTVALFSDSLRTCSSKMGYSGSPLPEVRQRIARR